MTSFRLIYVLQCSWIVESVSTYIDSGIRLNVSSSTEYHRKQNFHETSFQNTIMLFTKINFFNFVLSLSACFSHWLIMRWTKYLRFCRFCLFFTFYSLTPRHVKTSDETSHQNCSEERKMSNNKFSQQNIENYLKITLQQLAHKPYTLCRQPYYSVECRISRSTTS